MDGSARHAAASASVRTAKPTTVARAASVYSSMWRDHNVFNMHRIPAITTGFSRWRPTPKDLVDSALVYALTALAVCGRAETAGAENRAPPLDRAKAQTILFAGKRLRASGWAPGRYVARYQLLRGGRSEIDRRFDYRL